MKRTILQRENIRKISISIDSVADVWKKEEKEKKKKNKGVLTSYSNVANIYNNEYLLSQKYCSNCPETVVEKRWEFVRVNKCV